MASSEDTHKSDMQSVYPHAGTHDPCLGRRTQQHRQHAKTGRVYDIALPAPRTALLEDYLNSLLTPLSQFVDLQDADCPPTHPLMNEAHADVFYANCHSDISPPCAQHAAGLTSQPRHATPQALLQSCLRPFDDAATLIVAQDERIIALNHAAAQRFDLDDYADICALPIHTEDAPALREALWHMARSGRASSRLIRVRSHVSDQIMLMRLQHSVSALPEPVSFVTCRDLRWTKNAAILLRTAFGLSETETDMIRALVLCGSVSTIAACRQRPLDAIQSEITVIKAKTDTQSQVELVRLALLVLDRVAPA